MERTSVSAAEPGGGPITAPRNIGFPLLEELGGGVKDRRRLLQNNDLRALGQSMRRVGLRAGQRNAAGCRRGRYSVNRALPEEWLLNC